MRVWWVALLAACSFPRAPLADGDAGLLDGIRSRDGASSDGASGAVSFVGFTMMATGLSNQIRIPASVTTKATYIVGVATRPYVATLSVSGLGTTWTAVADQCGARSQTGLAMYVARNATVSGEVTIGFAGSVTSSMGLVAVYVGSVGNGATARYNDVAVDTCSEPSPASDVDAYAFPIAALGGRVVEMVATRAGIHAPGVGLTQRAQQFTGTAGDVAGIALSDGTVTVVSGSFNNAIDVASVAVELR